MEEQNIPEGFSAAPIEPINVSSDPTDLLKAPIPVITKFIPDGVPPAININSQLQGDFNTGPIPNPNVRGETSSTSYVKAISSQLRNGLNNTQDRYAYARPASYGAGYKNMNYERYYSHGKFDELGFNPYRDNEALYNEKGSWFDDYLRAFVPTMKSIGTGVISALPGASLWGDEASWNEVQEKAMSIGTSNRGGFGSWITNFGLNAGYSVGILAELAVEDLVLGLATPFTGGTSLGVAGARTVSTLGKLGRGLNTTRKAFQTIRDVDKAKDVFSAAKGVGQGFVNFINPLEETTALVSAAAKGKSGWTNLDALGKISTSVGAFYNDARKIDLAFSEALLEGAGAKQRFIQSSLDQYYAENGVVPEGKEAEKITNAGESVKFNTVMLNAGLIYATNKIVFDDMFARRRTSFGAKESLVSGDKRFITRTAAKDFKAGATPLIKAGAEAPKWSVKGTLKKAFVTSPYSPLSLKYFSKNISEAFQEVGQESISAGMIEYETRRMEDPAYSGAHQFLASVGYGLGKQLSLEGLNVFAQGYLTGGLLGVLQGGLTKGLNKADQVIKNYGKDKATIEKEETERQNKLQEQSNSRINAINFLAENAIELDKNRKIENSVSTIVSTNEAKEAGESGDVKAEKDLSFESEWNHTYTVVSSGSTDLLDAHFDDILKLDDETFAEAYNLDKSNSEEIADARKALQERRDKLRKFERRYKKARVVFPNEEDPSKINKKEFPEEYKASVQRYVGWEKAVRDALFNIDAIENVSSRLSSITDTVSNRQGFFKSLFSGFKLGKPFSEVSPDDVSSLLDVDQRLSKKQSLTAQINILETGTAEQKKQAEYLKTQLAILNEWDQMVDHHNRIVEQADKSSISPEQQKNREAYLKFRKGTRVKDKKTGEEYVITDVKSDGTAVLTKSKLKVGSRYFSKSATPEATYEEILETTPEPEKAKVKSVNRLSASKNYEVIEESTLPEKYAGMGDDVTESLSYMYDVYERYMRHIGKMNDVEVMTNALNEAFDMIKDFYYLDNDRRSLAKSVNILSDPDYFRRYAEVRTNIQKEIDKRREASVLKGFQRSKEIEDKNSLLSELFDIGVFVPEDEVAYLLKNDLRGEELSGGMYRGLSFYDEANKKPVPYDSDKFKKILEVIEAYEKKNQTTVIGKPIIEEKVALKIFGLEKSENDQRTLKDLAEQFGFDLTKDSSEVSIHELIKAVIDSTYLNEVSTIGKAEITLLRRLLNVIPSDAKVTFVKNLDSMNKYDPSTKELFIDPRYAASDYMGRTGYPIELAITHGLVTKVATEKVLEDASANNRVTELREKTVEFLNNNKLIDNRVKKLLTLDKSLTDNIAFVAEAMMNGEFQKVLADIKLDKVERPSVWKEFINQIKAFLAEKFGIDANSTVLEAVQEIFGAGLEQVSLPKTETKPTTEQKKPGQVSSATPIEEMEASLINDLVSAYREEYKGEDIFPNSEASGDDIVSSKRFKDFVESSNKANEVINDYNQKKEPVAEKPKPAASTIPPKTAKFVVNDNIEFTGIAYTPDGTIVQFEKEPFTVKSILDKTYDIDQERNVQYVRLEDSNGNMYEFDLLGPDEYTVDVVKKPTPKGPEVTTTPVSDIEAKIADIERRRQEKRSSSDYPIVYLRVKKRVVDGDNKILEGEDADFQNQSIERTIANGIKRGLTREQIFMLLSANDHVFSFGADTIAINNFIQNRIDGKDNRTFQEFKVSPNQEIDTQFDTEYLEAFEKGEMSREQAIKALYEAARVDGEVYKKLVSSEETAKPKEPVKPKEKAKPTKTIKSEYRGKFIYATPGSGKTTIAEQALDVIDTDDLMVEEMLKRHPEFTRKENESIQDYILRYVKEYPTEKNSINDDVYDRVREYLDQGKTVLTGTKAFIPDVDFAISVPASNERVLERFKNSEEAALKFKKKEAEDIKKADTKVFELEDQELEDFLLEEPSKPKEKKPTKRRRRSYPGVFNTVSQFYNEYNNIKNENDLKNWNDKVIATINSNKFNDLVEDNLDLMDTEFIDKMVQDKKQELAKDFTFEDLTVNDIVLMRDDKLGYMRVSSKRGNTIYLAPIGNETTKTQRVKVEKGNIKEMIMYKANDFIDSVLPASEKPTQEQIDDLNTVNEESKNDKFDAVKLLNELEGVSKEDALKRLKDSLDRCNL